MNISYNWLKDFIDFDLTPEQTAAALTSTGLETGSVEEVESIRGGLKGLVIGRVLTCVEHPDSDHLHITTVDLGGDEPVQIVCGAPNVASGQTVVVATVGTVLYDGDKSFQIKKSKIRGVESLGMICAEDEIGVGSSHAGIIVLPDGAAAPGTPAADYYGLTSDYVLEVDLTPNRIDAASHMGVARDLAAYLSCHANATAVRRPDVTAFRPDRPDGAAPVELRRPDLCTRYSGVTIRGVKVTESPEWLRRRLTAIGQRPINNIVDITNYILHGIGQPLHCFDLAKVKDDTVIVDTVAQGTRFVTLDSVERTLDERDLMICSPDGPMCIAGVFGGLDSGVTDTTTDIFLESACFNPTSVRRTARRHGLSTDASFRYERGTDPNLTLYAVKLAALLVKELAGGEICGEPVDIYPAPVEPYPVKLSYDYLNSLVGKKIPRETVDAILRTLDIEEVGRTADEVDLRVATYRVDVRRPCDVVEEVLRIYGYNNVETGTDIRSTLSTRSEADVDSSLRRIIGQQLTATGFNEIMCNSLTSERFYTDSTTYPADTCVRLLNPLSSDLSIMRRTLLYGGLESLSRNINRKLPDVLAYEFGNVYALDPKAEITAEHPLSPFAEEAMLGLWITGDARRASWLAPTEQATFYHLKATVANILARLGISTREIKLSVDAPDAVADIFSQSLTVSTRSGALLGRLGVVAARPLALADIKQPVYFAELCWSRLVRLAAGRSVKFSPMARTLPVKRDLALLIDKAVTMAEIENAVREAERKLLREVTLFDVYEGDKLPEGKKSYAISLTLQDDERTLTDTQIDSIMTKVTAQLAKRTGATLR